MNKSNFINTLSTAKTSMLIFKTGMLIIKSLFLAIIWCILLITSKSSVFSKANLSEKHTINAVNSISSQKIIQNSETITESKDSNMAETIPSDITKIKTSTITSSKTTSKTITNDEATAKTLAGSAGKDEGTAVQSETEDMGMAIEDKALVEVSTEVKVSAAVEENTVSNESKTAKSPEAVSVSNLIGTDDSDQFSHEQLNYEEALAKLGYLNESTYDHAYNVYIAVLLFQSSHNLVVDGSWGDSSMQALIKHIKSNVFMYRDKVANPASDGKWIAINLTKRLLTLYEGTEVICKYPIAVGNPPILTPEGKYLIVNKLVNPYWGGGGYAAPVAGGSPYNPLGYRWLGISIGDGYSYGIHGTNSPYSIGTNASQGCIRMPNFCVEQLFEIVEIGTPVWIGFDETLVSWGIEQIEY